jgi:hypothetical protein
MDDVATILCIQRGMIMGRVVNVPVGTPEDPVHLLHLSCVTDWG